MGHFRAVALVICCKNFAQVSSWGILPRIITNGLVRSFQADHTKLDEVRTCATQCNKWDLFSESGQHSLSNILAIILFASCALGPIPTLATVSFDDIEVPPSFLTPTSKPTTNPNAVDAAETLASSLGTSLKAPTKEKPQIMFEQSTSDEIRVASKTRVILPQGTRLKNGMGGDRQPLLQGMVYILDNSETQDKPRPSPIDTLVLLAKSPDGDNDDNVIAGAKVKISKARFPMTFSMYEENLLVSKDKWLDQYSTQDNIMIEALICPASEDEAPSTKKRWCSESESSFKAVGIARLIRNLPGLEDGVGIRAAAALPLQ